MVPNPLQWPFFEGAKCSSRGTWSDLGSFSVFPRSRNDAKIDPVLVRRLRKPSRRAGSETTCFSQNHSNPSAAGTLWLLKGHFFDGDCLSFCFCCVSLCSVLYNIFFCQKTSVNAQPLSPLFFRKSPHIKRYKFFYHFGVCVCVFSIFSYFC